ncbi:MAG: hypothetical protein KDB23_16715 [Planctomycetales bacterium]|nr:hypothetical protein [Planctomycetales bacterium]
MKPITTLLFCGLLFSAADRSAVKAAEPIIRRGAEGWRYLNSSRLVAPDATSSQWFAAEFNESKWPAGKALLGYGDPDVATNLADSDVAGERCATVLFRRRFRVAEAKRFRLFRGSVCCDDGAVVYFNGREVYRHNMPAGELSLATNAVRAVGPETKLERAFHPFAVDSKDVIEGENVLAISVHQANRTSGDLAFDLELAGLDSDAEVAEFRRDLEATASELQVKPASLKLKPVARIQVFADPTGK